MAQTIHELAIELQGEVDSRFGSSINEVENSLRLLASGVKDLGSGAAGIDGASASFVKLNHESMTAAQRVGDLQRMIRQIESFEKRGPLSIK